ncbi:MAG: serine hydrolase domain-containing protein, partial [Candidatus Latescibacteria bacterium]|nr:serine hydrolase domain-containing protein [Candidatus Latescibacterota bacterium]
MKSEEIGFSSEGYQQACNILQSAVDANELMGGVLQVSRGGPALPVFCCGRRELSQGVASVVADTIFLIASITKPIVCASVVKLIEQGQVRLDDRVVYFVPEFGNRGKDAVTVRHLLTHTSGLPDMLPENHGLRAKHTPLSEFVAQMCDLDLLFEPGTRISYQSCGIAILGEIVERLEGRPLR